MSRRIVYLGISIAAALPLLVSAVPVAPNSSSTFKDLVVFVVGVINLLIPILGGVAILIFFIGVIRYILAAGGTTSKIQARQMFLWGIIALFVLFSIGGILALLQNTFLGQGGTNQNNSNTQTATFKDGTITITE